MKIPSAPGGPQPPSGYREFSTTTVERIRMAKALQDLGLTLDEVVDALHAHDTGGATCASERWRLEAVVDRIDTKIAQLRQARRNALQTLEDCRAGQRRLTQNRGD